jgi:hypothetical protein
MKIGGVLTACTLDPLYSDFIQSFIRCWSALLPSAKVRVLVVGDQLPDGFSSFAENLILFRPPVDVPPAFVSQYVRLLYPALMNVSGGVLISDVDMLPMNSRYYEDNIAKFPDDCFIYYRHVLLENSEIAMCYNVASPFVWGQIFGVRQYGDILSRLSEAYGNVDYDGLHGGLGWSTDQRQLFAKVNEWHSRTGRYIHLNDWETGFRRLDRADLAVSERSWWRRSCLTWGVRRRILRGDYSDYHACRPYSEFKAVNDEIVELLCRHWR